MRNSLASGLCFLALAGCTAAGQGQLQQAIASPAGQLFCGIATASGPIVAAMIQAQVNGAVAPLAIIATDQTAAYVAAVCATAGGVPVSPPANPSAAPQIAVDVAAVKLKAPAAKR